MKKLLLISASLLVINLIHGQNRINYNYQQLFLSGMNLAWINYANDLNSFNAVEFTRALDEVKAAGGNTIRWWLHVTGAGTPTFTNDSVTGISQTAIANLQTAVNLAQERGVGLILCLWSFGMLDSESINATLIARNKKMLTDTNYTRKYINNALIPMIDSLKGHKGIICWEIFNEPEGMASDANDWAGWLDTTVAMVNIQRFINLATGAIHRTDPNALVSSGAWNVAVNTDITLTGGGIPSSMNFYRNDRLIASGGDIDGTLDFYMIHYYADHGTNSSPFHHPASYWGLDKPIVVAEFSANGPYPGITPEAAYRYLYDNGYAGALGWTWTAHDGNGGLTEATPGISYLHENYPEDIDIIIDSSLINFTPYIVKQINDTSIKKYTADSTFLFFNFENTFYDVEDSTKLFFSIDSVTNMSLLSASIDGSKNVYVTIHGEQSGFGSIYVKAADSTGKFVTDIYNISVYDPESEDKALLRFINASSIEDDVKLPPLANDGKSTTRWSSEYADNEWLEVTFDTVKNIQRVFLNWEAAYGSGYDVLVSKDEILWDTVFKENYGNGSYDLIIFDPIDAKYIKLDLRKRGTQWGFSLWDFEVYATPGVNTLPYLKSVPDTFEVFSGNEVNIKASQFFGDNTVGDQLKFAATNSDNSELNDWIRFTLPESYAGASFVGTPFVSDTGVYNIKVTATDRYGESISKEFTVIVKEYISSVNKVEISKLEIYPNPANEYIYISNEIIPESIIILDNSGREIKSIINHQSGESIYIGDLKSGIYTIILRTDSRVYSNYFLKK